MRLYLAAEGSITALIYQPPHPWGASDGPDTGRSVTLKMGCGR